MSRIVIVCLSWLCDNTLYVIVTEEGDKKYELCGGELCKECQDEQDAPKKVKFDPPRFGQTTVSKPDDFSDMMAKRKIDNRKKSGKGPGRGNR